LQAYCRTLPVMQWASSGAASGLSPSALRQSLLAKLQAANRGAESVSVDVEASDAAGAFLDLDHPASRTRMCLLYVRLVVSLGVAGAVALADTFLHVAAGRANALLTTEACAPYFRAWAGPGAEDFYACRVARSVADGQVGIRRGGMPWPVSSVRGAMAGALGS
jgi:hypothetical protein